MSWFQERWERRQTERENIGSPAPGQVLDIGRLEDELQGIWLSTLCDDSRPYQPVGLLQGDACDDPDVALLLLKRRAREEECDAVLGVGICSASSGAVAVGNGAVHSRFFAYGTGVRWVTG